MNVLLALLALLAAGYALLAGALFLQQPKLLYLPDMPGRELEATPAQSGMAYEAVTLHSADGERIDAWFVPVRQPRATLLFCHGNAGNISHRLESIRQFHALGMDVLIFDYRGYGRSSGKPSEQGTYADARAAWDYLVTQRGVPARDIVLFGRSLGAAVAAQLATRTRPAGLILESGFTSVPDVAARLYPWLPVRWLSRYRYDTLNRLPDIQVPVMVIHSRGDEIIPFAHGERLYAAAHEPKRFLVLRGGHNDGFQVSGDGYARALDEFVAMLRGESAASGAAH